MLNRILFITLFAFCCVAGLSQTTDSSYFMKYYRNKRIVVIMFDGFGMSYFNNTAHPTMDSLIRTGFYKEVKALMPTVTNCNNVSICTGTFPVENGITGNSFLSENGEEEYMESSSLVNAPNLFERLKKYKKHSALISSKKKTLSLLSPGTDIAISPESADADWIQLLGQPPSIYSAEVNYWSMDAALYLLKNKKKISCLYIHTTDYPMHTWEPTDINAQNHITVIDHYIAEIIKVAPDAIIMITADHDVNHKNKCVDIEKSLEQEGLKVKIAISAERDKYLKHHRGFGGTSFVYLNNEKDSTLIKNAILKINGVLSVLTNTEAVALYKLDPRRIGDLVVLADSLTVFGELETAEEELPSTYRTHGSEYESRVPLMIFNAEKIPPASYFIYNKDLIRWLFENN